MNSTVKRNSLEKKFVMKYDRQRVNYEVEREWNIIDKKIIIMERTNTDGQILNFLLNEISTLHDSIDELKNEKQTYGVDTHLKPVEYKNYKTESIVIYSNLIDKIKRFIEKEKKYGMTFSRKRTVSKKPSVRTTLDIPHYNGGKKKNATRRNHMIRKTYKKSKK